MRNRCKPARPPKVCKYEITTVPDRRPADIHVRVFAPGSDGEIRPMKAGVVFKPELAEEIIMAIGKAAGIEVTSPTE